MRWLRALVVLLLILILALLFLIEQDLRTLANAPSPCGDSGDPCSVAIEGRV